MITFGMFICLWVCTAKDIKPAKWMAWGFIAFLLVTALVHIENIYLYPVLALYVALAIYALVAPWKTYYGNPTRSWKKRWISNPGELMGYRLAVWLLRLLPLNVLSWMGGKLVEIVGPHTRRQKIIEKNLAMIMPENNNPEFIRRVWNNWGRTFAEGLKYDTYLKHMDKYVGVRNLEITKKYKQFIIAMPHLGMMSLTALPLLDRGQKIGVTYKYPTNPLTNNVLLSSYGLGYNDALHFIPVGYATPMVRALKNGDILNINSDQRFKGAPLLDFMGHPARTATGIVQLARKFNLPMVVAHVRRTHGAAHEVVYDEVIELPNTDDAAADELRGMQMVNDAMSRAIVADAAEYLWMHNRWA